MKTLESVADILERELDFTIKEWLRRVNLVPDLSAIPLTDANRTAHLPFLFDDLHCRLRRGRNAKPIISIAAAEHGMLRFEQGYSAPMLVEESRIVQVSTFRTLHVHQMELKNHDQVLLDVITIADESDRQLIETLRGFMTAQAAA